QAWSCCGHTARNNRRSRGRFVCRACGFALHADLNAARNSAAKYHADAGIAGAEMRPRRWYTDEHAPPARAAHMTSALWRYRSLAQRHTNDAAPTLERRLCFARFQSKPA
nr:transposase [Chloroflexota bacterium]